MGEIKLGIIGVGNIGSSIANGLLWSGFKGRIILCDKHPEKVENFHSDFVEVVSEAALATGKSDVIILAVKPHAVKDAIAEIGDSIKGKLLISLAAGITLGELEGLAKGARICRVMPNVNCKVLEGAMAYAISGTITETDHQAIREIFGRLGTLIKVKENQIDIITAACASSPAYVFLIIQKLKEILEENGIDSDSAQKLAAQAVAGSGKMVLESELTPPELINVVKTKGGTTEAGLKILEKRNFAAVLEEAIKAADKRAKELKIGLQNLQK